SKSLWEFRIYKNFLESQSLEGGAVSVDLLKIARNVSQRQQPHNANRKIRPLGNKLKLIVDAENCLDRLYGGYFSGLAAFSLGFYLERPPGDFLLPEDYVSNW
ncbi:hypothetical protein NQ317_008079, partial [Molorchus minor]